MNQTALVLFAHGSRDPAWYVPFENLAARLRARMPGAAISLAYLEFGTPDLPGAIAQAAAGGATQIRVVPVFLAAGKHLREDLPVLIASARAANPHVQIELAPPVGEDPRMLDAMAQVIAGA